MEKDGGRLERILKLPKRVFYDGVLRRKYQVKAAKRMGWKEKNLTIANAAVFGIGSSVLFYFIGDEIRELANSEYIQSFQNKIVSGVANFIGVTTKTLLYTYATLDAGQSSYRIYYSSKTKKAMPSISAAGFFFNTVHPSLSYVWGRLFNNSNQKIHETQSIYPK